MFAECGLKKTDVVLVAVSGGADSLALLHVLRGAGYPLLVAHYNHRLRPEADSDAAFVGELALQLGLPFVTDSGDVAAYAAMESLSTEEAAREMRYRFLFRAARSAGAQAVATGHTADDQAETLLMHFLRGSGLAGLKGMLPRTILPAFDAEIPLVRPLLTWTRQETEAYCREHSLRYLTDASNADTTYFRNRLRHELLPQLEAYNPQIRRSLARSAQALQGDYELLNQLVDSAWDRSVIASGGRYVSFDLSQLREMPPALRRNLFRRAAFALKPGLRDVDFSALDRAAKLSAVELAGGLKTVIEAGFLHLTDDESSLPAEQPQLDGTVVVQYGQNTFGDWILACEQVAQVASPLTDRFSALLDADLAAGKLTLRSFRPGDRFEPLGMPGQTVKLSDLFVNLKIPKRLRERWPVLCVNDEIAWIPGLRMSERFKVTAQTKRAIKLELKRLP